MVVYVGCVLLCASLVGRDTKYFFTDLTLSFIDSAVFRRVILSSFSILNALLEFWVSTDSEIEYSGKTS